MTIAFRGRLLATTILLCGAAAPAFAQEAPPPAQAADGAQEGAQDDVIVVTGSILRRTDAATPSPVTTVTAESLDQRGISTVQEGIQMLSSNNGPALTNNFTANGAFAGGASSVSLRGLTTNSTLVLFDGLRAAYFPLADDGSRNFVDLNTIPDDIVERIEVLRDGASSSYGADAIAGVVNIITKREFKGISARAEAGISEQGTAANQRLSLTVGTGDLAADGFNAYLSGFYVHSDMVYNRDLRSPYNSADQRGICNGTPSEATCGPNDIVNGFDYAGNFPNLGFAIGAGELYVQPFDATNTTRMGRFQLLNPAGCQYGTQPYRPTAEELAGSANASVPTLLCQQDTVNRYGVVAPKVDRFGFSGRVTASVGDDSEAYAMINFQQSRVGFTGNPAVIRNNAPTGIYYPRFSTSTGAGAVAPGSGVLTLPVWVCPERTDCANSPNRALNPNNPFAAEGQVARLVGALGSSPIYNETTSRVYRGAIGIQGSFGDGFSYNVEGTAMHTDLRRLQRGFVYIQHLLDVIADGSYNFVNQEANSQEVQDYLHPDNISHATSDLYMAQATVGKDLMALPGGPLQLGLGASIRYEAVDAPSANSDINGPTERYFTLNAFGAVGNRTVYSAFGELNAPILDQLEVNASGRYDSYSSGQHAFSPKIGIKIKPIEQLVIRGTYSRGFRIPSFGEANALPTTGFTPVNLSTVPQEFLSQYGSGCTQASQSGCPGYLTGAAYGLTTLASPDLDPEKSRSFTAGILVEPIRNVSLTVDYYNIKKTGAITTPDVTPAIEAYYRGQPIPDGFNIIADAPDPNFPNARPRIAFVESKLVNANEIKSEGIDFAVNGSFDLGPVRWSTALEASYIIDLSTTLPDGTKLQFVDTLGNYALTAGTGTFRWKGSWQNTLDFGDFALTGTLNYTHGYDLSAEDVTGEDTAGDCGLAPAYVPCRVDPYLTVDANASYKFDDRFTVYLNVLNLLDDMPPIDPVTYGAFLYNTVQGGSGIFGRQFKAGVKVNF